jgi:hypothetical protein
MAYKEAIDTDEILDQIPENGLVKPKWLRANLKLTSHNLTTYKSRGLKPDEKGFWNLREVCQFIAEGGKGQNRPDRKAAAVEILRRMKRNAAEDNPDVALVFDNLNEGLEGSLSRIRQMEKHFSLQVQEMAGDPICLANALKAWKEIQDLLRKHESESLAILERQRILIPEAEVHDFSVPDQVIDELMEQDDRSAVLEILEKALHKALEEVARK